MTKWSPASLSCESGWDWCALVEWRWMLKLCMHAISQSNLIWWWSCNWSNFSIHPQIQLQTPANNSAALWLDPPTLQTCHFKAKENSHTSSQHYIWSLESGRSVKRRAFSFSFSPLSIILGVPLMWSPGKFAPQYPKKNVTVKPVTLDSFPDRRFYKFWERD